MSRRRRYTRGSHEPHYLIMDTLSLACSSRQPGQRMMYVIRHRVERVQRELTKYQDERVDFARLSRIRLSPWHNDEAMNYGRKKEEIQSGLEIIQHHANNVISTARLKKSLVQIEEYNRCEFSCYLMQSVAWV